MSPEPWTLFGRALLDGLAGRVEPPGLEVILEDGERLDFPVEELFSDADGLAEAELFALKSCRGRVLDIGAGAGRHALVLQDSGHDVTALDLCPQAVEVMRRRGLRQVFEGDVFSYEGNGEPFDTVLLLMTGIGVVGDLDGLDRFLGHAKHLLADGGCIVFDSWDPVPLEEPRPAPPGAYPGETLQRFAYQGEIGPPFPWLYVDAETVLARSERHGYRGQVIYADSDGSYLGRLTPA